ncbi:MAG TPA: alpha/beta hydrolase-fold protein [Armatimonadaceae bacterium]|nr:alpha/beta hydrolase-fold protein [Armatimonadaceae bacterium]
MKRAAFLLAAAMALLSAVPALTRAAAAAPLPRFHVAFTSEVEAEPFTGRVLVYLGRAGDGREPRSGPNWFAPQPFFALDVKNIKAGETITVGGPNTKRFPRDLKELPDGPLLAQAVLDRNVGGESRVGAGAGNGFSSPVALPPTGSEPVRLLIDKTVEPAAFRETARTKDVVVPSKLLSDFYKRPTVMRAAVVLPEGYAAETARRYPVLYAIPGFGGRHFQAEGYSGLYTSGPAAPKMLFVMLDPDCATGHHVFADSASNGPRGRALVEELIPAIEKQFRAIGKPGARFVAGHSSGGWSSLWLQVTYTDTFGGVWSTSPDPVDFRDFQRIDLYAKDANMFRDAAGKPRPIARRGDTPVLYYQQFSDMEDVLGRGGQLASFEAVFSPRGRDGQPRPLWDRVTGAVDPETVRAWQKYDIRLKLERDWKTLGPKLAGKLHVYTGGVDTFYLEGAVALLKESLTKLGSDAKVEVIPGKDHGSILDAAMRERLAREMAETLKKNGVDTEAAGTPRSPAVSGR